MNYTQHRIKWNNCQNCSLCKTRKHVVLGRGQLPCDVLFVGEAPGASEDVLGQPFSGPAGALLDRVIAKALKGHKVAIAFTNLVACIPLGENGAKTVEPSVAAIEACADRLDEFYRLANPKAIVCVGKLSTEHMEGYNDGILPYVSITHPAAILRAKEEQQGLLIQTCILTITDLLTDLGV